ncbi:hypothetical protein PM082_011706 [Marasmius tenuissimus]|nr:hypothetical protein PM082_011706 [Marasmius tenuissimus]
MPRKVNARTLIVISATTYIYDITPEQCATAIIVHLDLLFTYQPVYVVCLAKIFASYILHIAYLSTFLANGEVPQRRLGFVSYALGLTRTTFQTPWEAIAAETECR